MADLLSIGTSGINIYQRSLATTGTNITNVDSEGYSVQRHQTTQSIDSAKTNITIGNGVQSVAIKRAYDEFATGALRNSTSSLYQQNSLYDYARKLENIIGDTDVSVTSAIDRFFAAAHQLSASPSSTSSREALLNEALSVAERFNGLARQFEQLDVDSFIEIDSRIQKLNTLSTQLASVNESLYTKKDINSQPNGLLDQRDTLLQQISEFVRISVKEEGNGVVKVYLGEAKSGYAIVDGNKAISIKAERIENNSEKLSYTFDPYGSPESISSLVSGSISGIENFRSTALVKARNELDGLAIGFMNAVNKVQMSGLDGAGQEGREMFGLAEEMNRAAADLQMLIKSGDEIATGALLMVDQSGSANLLLESWDLPSANLLRSGEVSITDEIIGDQTINVSAGAGVNKAFVIEGNKLQDLSLLIDQSAGEVQIFTRNGHHLFGDAAGLNLDTLMTSANGFNVSSNDYNGTYLNASGSQSYKGALNVINAQGANDQFTTNGMIGDDLIVFVSNGSANFSGGWVEPTETIAKQQLASEIDIKFTSNSRYEIWDSKTNMLIEARDYQSGDKISYNGWSASLDNLPVAGDVYTIKRNNSPRGDNRNVLKLTELQTDRSVFNGRGNFSEVYSDVVNDLGAVVVQASISRDAQQTLTDEARQTRDGVSAVSLDEEAANLLRFQQAYQASAQVIQAANKLFDSILSIR